MYLIMNRPPQPGAYAKAWARIRHAGSDAMFQMGWPRGVVDRETLVREYGEALDRRINLRGGQLPLGRKLTERYQTDLRRDARDLEGWLTQRIRVYGFRCKELNHRFSHVLARSDD